MEQSRGYSTSVKHVVIHESNFFSKAYFFFKYAQVGNIQKYLKSRLYYTIRVFIVYFFFYFSLLLTYDLGKEKLDTFVCHFLVIHLEETRVKTSIDLHQEGNFWKERDALEITVFCEGSVHHTKR
jgi:hypothetical protein